MVMLKVTVTGSSPDKLRESRALELKDQRPVRWLITFSLHRLSVLENDLDFGPSLPPLVLSPTVDVVQAIGLYYAHLSLRRSFFTALLLKLATFPLLFPPGLSPFHGT